MLFLTMFIIIVSLTSTCKLMESQLVCQMNSCVHGVCKPAANDSYECFCENGYTGYHCETNYNDCVSFPCLNEASCVDLVAGVQCICPQGFTGSFCESVLDHCSSQPCLNGGTCYDFPEGFNCICGIGFAGQNCEVDIDVCNSLEFQQIQCFNGGTCIEGVGLSFACSCVSGFEGPRCETNIDECFSQPCQHNGTCVDQLEGFVCVCSYRWTGTYCELEQEMCDPEVCSNRGLCVGNATVNLCYCIPDFHGPSCQWRYDECIPKPRCFHGGTCVDGVDDFTCSCLPGFIGKRCEMHCHNNCSADAGETFSAVPYDERFSMTDDCWTTMSPPSLLTLDSYWESQFATSFISSHNNEFDSNTVMESSALTAAHSNSYNHGFDTDHSEMDDNSWLEIRNSILVSSYPGFTVPVWSSSPSKYYPELATSFEMPDLGSLATAFDPKTSLLRSSLPISDISSSFLSQNRDMTVSPILPSARVSEWWLTSPLQSCHSPLIMTPLLSTSWLKPEDTPSDVIVSSPDMPSWWVTTTFQTFSVDSSSFSDGIFTESTYASDIFSTSSNFSINHSLTDGTIQPASLNSCWSTLPFGTSDIDTDQSDPLPHLLTSSPNVEFSEFYLISSDLMWPEIESLSNIAFDVSTLLSLRTMGTDDWQSKLFSSQFLGSISAMLTPVPVPSLPFLTAILKSSEVLHTEFEMPSSVKMTSAPSVNTQPLPTDAIQSMTPISSSLVQTAGPLSSHIVSISPPMPHSDSPNFPCYNITCKNNGICQPSAKDLETFKCHCRLLFAGTYCEFQLESIETPSFDGSSYLIYDLRSDANGTGDFTIQLTFESIAENGIVFYVDFSPNECLETFMMLETENGLTVLSFSCGSQSIVSMEEGLRVDDGARHTVAVGMQWYHNALGQVICNVSMQLDHWPPLTGQQHDVPSLCHVAHLNLGGVNERAGEVNTNELNGKIGFRGCVVNASVNERVLNLVSGAADGLNVQECISVLCASGICQHGSRCRNVSKANIECECPAGFTGQFCERHQCPDSFCQAGGTCLPTRMERNDRQQYVCLCPFGFYGLYCEQAQSKIMEEIAFSGSFMGYSSFIAMPLPIFNEKSCFEMKISFVSEGSSQNELLLFVGQAGLHLKDSSFLAVGLIDTSVVMQYNLGTGTELLRYDDQIRCDRKHHLLTIGFNESLVWMRIDNETEVTISAMATNHLRFTDWFGTYLYIGGHIAHNFTTLPANLLFFNGFTGCVTDIRINNDRVTGLQTGNQSVFGRNIHQCPTGKCSLSCRNGGTCVSLGASFVCLCPAGWIGPLCSDPYDPCASGAHHCTPNSDCIVEVQGYRCACSLGWTGAQCDQGLNFSTPYFNGIDSYMAFLPHNIRHRLTLRVQFQPLSSSGVLFYTASQLKEGSSDFACLTLDEGYVEFRYNLGGGRFSTTVLRSRSKIVGLDVSWHTVDVWQRGGEATLAMDGQNVTGQALTGMVTLDTATYFYLGGLPNMDLIAKPASEKPPIPFHGCIRHFSVNGIPYALATQGPAGGRNIDNCSSSSTGFFNKCANGGTCILITQDNCQCLCVQPFTGPNCLDVLPCHFHVCQNGGICVPVESTDVQLQFGVSYSCDCPLGWMGKYCEQQSFQITEARFRGDGYILVADDNYPLSDRTKNRIALNFSTTIGNGLLLWTGVEPNFDDDYLAMGLEHGRIKVAWNLGWFSRSQLLLPLEPIGETLADSKWHMVVVYREKQRISIKLDDVVISANTPGSFTELNTLGVYYIGGLPRGANFTFWTNGHFHAGFVGCLKSIELSESKQAVDFMDAVSGSNVLQC